MLGKEVQIARFFVFFHDLFLCKNPPPPLNQNRIQNCAMQYLPAKEPVMAPIVQVANNNGEYKNTATFISVEA